MIPQAVLYILIQIKKILDFIKICVIICFVRYCMKGEWGNPLTFIYGNRKEEGLWQVWRIRCLHWLRTQ